MVMKDWWDKNHLNEGIKYLGNYDATQIWSKLEIEDRIVANASVLNVGIGTGRCTQALYRKGMEVSVLDITPHAFDKLHGDIKKYLVGDEMIPDQYDLIISHLVAQHMDDVDLVDQIRFLLLTLKKDGVFAMQFANSEIRRQDEEAQQIGGVHRHYAEIEDLVKEAGGVVIRRTPEYRFNTKTAPWAGMSHVGVKIVRPT